MLLTAGIGRCFTGKMIDFENHIAEVSAMEKYRPHIDCERCIMSIRFSKEVMGTQFHPEADPAGMKLYLMEEDKKKFIIDTYGEAKVPGHDERC